MAVLASLAAVVAGCGTQAKVQSTPPASPQGSDRFPKPTGETLDALAGPFPTGLKLSPVVAVLRPGRHRFRFRLLDSSRNQIGDAPTALYLARGPDSPARGPYDARFVRSPGRTRASGGKGGRHKPRRIPWMYVARVRFSSPGTYRAVALMRLDGRLIATPPIDITVIGDDQR